MTQAIQPPVLADLDAEKATFSALLNEQVAIESIDLQAHEFHAPYHVTLFETMLELWSTGCPLTVGLIHHDLVTKKKLAQCKPPDGVTVKDYLNSLKAADVHPDHIRHYAGIVKKLARVRAIVELNANVIRAAYDNPDPDKLDAMITEGIMKVTGGRKSHVITWRESIDRYEAILDERERRASLPADQQKIVDFPWEIWNKYILPLTPGSGLMIAAPPNTGKTIFLEDIAEYCARRGLQVAFFQFELDEEDMGDRRTGRWTGIHRPVLQGKMSEAYREHIKETGKALKGWRGGVNYVHCPGWTAERVVMQALAMKIAGMCDVLVIDYHQKFRGSPLQWRQLKDKYVIEADNMEIIKTFAQQEGIPFIVASQMTKGVHNMTIEEVTNENIRGAGELSEKVNITLIALPEVIDGKYTGVIGIKITKNKGPKLIFRQRMVGPLYTMDRNWADDPESPLPN